MANSPVCMRSCTALSFDPSPHFTCGCGSSTDLCSAYRTVDMILVMTLWADAIGMLGMHLSDNWVVQEESCCLA